MKKILIKLFLFLFLFLLFPNFSAVDFKEIKIALYDSISPSVFLLEKSLHFSWKDKNTIYEMKVNRIDFIDIINGSLKEYDVLVIGASGRQYFLEYCQHVKRK